RDLLGVVGGSRRHGSDSLPVEDGTLPGTEPAQRAVRAGGVGPVEYPVLPGGQPAEDLRFHGLRAGEPVVGPRPVSASGLKLARSSVAIRISSSQSMSSGAKVIRPRSAASSASSAALRRLPAD